MLDGLLRNISLRVAGQTMSALSVCPYVLRSSSDEEFYKSAKRSFIIGLTASWLHNKVS